MAFFCRGAHPSAIRDVTLDGINVPVRIGDCTVLPGDVVPGKATGVTFTPPHLAQAVVERSEDLRSRDEFGPQRLREGRYAPGEIDRATWPEEIGREYQQRRA